MANILKHNHSVHIDSADYVLNLLPPAKRKSFEQHLAQCDECLEAVTADRALEQMVRDTVQALPVPTDATLMSLMPAPPPSDFYRRKTKSTSATQGTIFSFLRWWQPAFSMCLILLLFAGTFALRTPATTVIDGTSTSTTTATMTATQVLYTATAVADRSQMTSTDLTPVPMATPIAQLIPLSARQIEPDQ